MFNRPSLLEAVFAAVIVAGIASLAFCGPAKSAEFTTINRTASGFIIMHGEAGSAAPHVIHRDANLSDEAAERASRWEGYCQPKIVAGKYGTEKYVYAHAGCEFGRDHE